MDAYDRAGWKLHYGALKALKDALPERDIFLHGYQEIRAWFRDVAGVLPPNGPTPRTIAEWRRSRGCPICPGKNWRRPPFTSTFLLTAWLISDANIGQWLTRNWKKARGERNCSPF